jgi:ATP-dependent Lon protease
MSLDDLAELPEGFAGLVRVFPLPGAVMFPHALQPLHVFEPRYVAMLEDALAEDHLLAMALLQPGWEPSYEERPPIFPVICIGRVVSHTRMPDGRYNLLLLGLRRASVLRELPPSRAYREAEVSILEDLYPPNSRDDRRRLQRALLKEFKRCLPSSLAKDEPLEQLLSRQLPLGVLTDIVAFTVKFDMHFKQKLLSEWNVDLRAQLLLKRLADWDPEEQSAEQPFPPRFSPN